jgi:RNA polymerase primary sigma factor
MTTSSPPKTAPSSAPTSGADLRSRADEILRADIDFIPNDEFGTEEPGDAGFVETTLADLQSFSNAPAELPGHLRRMCDSDLLTHEQEMAFFREFNYLKFQASTLRSRLATDNADRHTIETIEKLLQRARTIRDQIIQANTRLVMSVVKKFVTPQQSFDDMLSDGLVTLMHAVEKFDYDRGFRFSTYAYRSIARNAYRMISLARKEEGRFTRDVEERAFESEGDEGASGMAERVWGNLRKLAASMLDQLDRRERFIIRSRYALGAHRKVRTFQFLADKLGVSKERVRQLEQRAVSKLQAMAAEYEADDLFNAAMV